ncbi:MAG: histidyl-tRNA synthetase, partial [Candidatus Krumholzibacteriia bacterium]
TAMALFEAVGAKGLTVKLNSIGCPECRPAYLEELKVFLKENLAEIPEKMQGRIDINPLRLYDAKDDGVQKLLSGFKPITEALCENCREHHRVVCETLAELNVPVEQDPSLVRGLDYYCRTTFEVTATDGRKQSSLCGGGRYDYLVEQCGGPATPAIGFSIGIERTLLHLDEKPVDLQRSPQSQVAVFIACKGLEAQRVGFKLADQLREFCSVEVDLTDRSLKAQSKSAFLRKAEIVLVVGESDDNTEIVSMKNIATGQQESLPLANIPAAIQEVLAE